MSTAPPVATDPATLPEALDRAIAQVAQPDRSFTAEANHLAERTAELSRLLVAYGDRCPVAETEIDPGDADCGITHFVWAERAKHFLLLYRNVQVQLQTAALLVHDGQAEGALVARLHERSLDTLREARREWTDEVDTLATQLDRDPAARRRQLADWHRQQTPWPAYREQLAQIGEQAAELAAEHARLQQQIDHFARLRDHLRSSITAAETALAEGMRRADEIVTFVLESEREDGTQSPGRIAGRLEEGPADPLTPQRLHDFQNELANRLGELDEQRRITVGTDHGLLRYKDVNLRRATEQYVSAEIMPLVYELWEMSETATAGLSVAMANVRNRALLLAGESTAGKAPPDYRPEELRQPFANFLDRTERSRTAFTELRDRALRRIEADLRLTAVYRPEPGFLPLPLQRGLSDFTRRQVRLADRARHWLRDTFSGVAAFRGLAEREDRLSISEKTVRVVRQRQPDGRNAGYTSILMTRGYIGESFLVGREDEAAQLRSLIEAWRAGYRGSALLTGRRLSGRTLFGEYVANRFFPGNTVRLRPGATLNFAGRRLSPGGDLAEALAFVVKHGLQQQPLVWIDDLETWHDRDRSLGANLRALGRAIDDHSHRIFFLAATTNAVHHHLDHFRDLDRLFQSTINLDNFSLADMQRAILIRHGATHRALVTPEGEPLAEAAVAKRIRRMHRNAYGNVGDTLNRWANQTVRYDDERVTVTGGWRHQLPDFLTPPSGLLLSTIYLDKRTTDYRLRKLFGPAYAGEYASTVQRLLRVGLLRRTAAGELEITESVVNDVGRHLTDAGLLNAERP